MSNISFSVCMPYYDRLELLEFCYDRMEDLYKNSARDLYFLSICDDGSPSPLSSAPFHCAPFSYGQRLPSHHGMRNPAAAINTAIAAAYTDWIVLTNPEIFHVDPILLEAKEFFEKPQNKDTLFCGRVIHLGEKWTNQLKEDPTMNPATLEDRGSPSWGRWWTSHPDFAPKPYHNLFIFHRSLWEKIGGIPYEYMAGLGWEDEDLRESFLQIAPAYWSQSTVAHLYHGEHYLGPEAQKLSQINEAFFRKRFPNYHG